MDDHESDGCQIKINAARSRFILLDQLSKHDLTAHINWDDTLPHGNDEQFDSPMNTQIDFVRHVMPSFDSVRAISSIFGINHMTYYQMFPRQHDQAGPPSCPLSVSRVGRPPLVPADLEERLLHYIGECQDRNDCLSPRECREWLSEELSQQNRTAIIDRYWWRRFLLRHGDLAVRRCDSREAARADVCRDQITPYIDALKDIVSQPFHPDLVINMDETGFTARPLKGARKNCVFSRGRSVPPRFLEAQDASHVTLVGAVTLSGSALIPLLLSTRVHLPPEIAGSYVSGAFRYFQTKKGYLTAQAMDFWVQAVPLTYVAEVRARLQGPITAGREHPRHPAASAHNTFVPAT
jgi:hypothetical protein